MFIYVCFPHKVKLKDGLAPPKLQADYDSAPLSMESCSPPPYNEKVYIP